MATVYLAHDPRFMRDVALKALPRQFTHDPMFRTRFEREAQTIAALEHPAIVSVHDFGEEDGQPFIVMRYMAGGSLSDRLRKGSLSLAAATVVLGRIASALDRAHSMGVIHRDLKPGNILFDQYEDAYLADFGIAKIAEATAALTGSGLIGTPAYMSPEQIKGEAIDGRSDIYSLGIILFEMLSGTQPYEATTPWGILSKQVNEPMPSILDKTVEMPPQLDTIMLQATAKDVRDRFQTATELATAITLLTRHRPSTLEPTKADPLPQLEAVEPPTQEPIQVAVTEVLSDPGLEEAAIESSEALAVEERVLEAFEAAEAIESATIETKPTAKELSELSLSGPDVEMPMPVADTEVISPIPETAVDSPIREKVASLPKWIWGVVVVLLLLFAGLAIRGNGNITGVPETGTKTLTDDITSAETTSDFIQTKWEEGFRVTDLSYADGSWDTVMSQDSPYGRQTWRTLTDFPGDYIQSKWVEGFRVTSMAYGNGLWAVVMSQDSPYGPQTWETSLDFPGDYVQSKWAEGLRVTNLTYGNGVWAVVMSQESPYGPQTWETSLDFPGDYIQSKWAEGFRVTNLAYGNGVWAVIMSQASPYGRQTWRTLANLPGDFIQDKWSEGFRVTSLTYGKGVWAVVLSQDSPYGRQTWRVLPNF